MEFLYYDFPPKTGKIRMTLIFYKVIVQASSRGQLRSFALLSVTLVSCCGILPGPGDWLGFVCNSPSINRITVYFQQLGRSLGLTEPFKHSSGPLVVSVL